MNADDVKIGERYQTHDQNGIREEVTILWRHASDADKFVVSDDASGICARTRAAKDLHPIEDDPCTTYG